METKCLTADGNYKVCPVCGSKLQELNGDYACSNDNCNVVIIDNHIFNLRRLVYYLFNDQDKDTSEVKDKLGIAVMNKQEVELYGITEHAEASVIISISSIGTNGAFIQKNKPANIVDILKIEFNDTDSEDKYCGGITYKNAKDIADFVKKYKNNKELRKIIVQCEAGQSRSAGIAAAILKYLYDDDTPIFNNKKYTPNMLCYRKVLTALMYEQ